MNLPSWTVIVRECADLAAGSPPPSADYPAPVHIWWNHFLAMAAEAAPKTPLTLQQRFAITTITLVVALIGLVLLMVFVMMRGTFRRGVSRAEGVPGANGSAPTPASGTDTAPWPTLSPWEEAGRRAVPEGGPSRVDESRDRPLDDLLGEDGGLDLDDGGGDPGSGDSGGGGGGGGGGDD